MNSGVSFRFSYERWDLLGVGLERMIKEFKVKDPDFLLKDVKVRIRVLPSETEIYPYVQEEKAPEMEKTD